MTPERLPASFRDPSGFLFVHAGVLYRQVNHAYCENYDLLFSSGLYDKLVQKRLLIPHEEASIEPAEPPLAYKIIRPERLAFVSYPYEWCFSQLKDAALTTLRIQKLALEAGMSLKDASAYNIQFHRGRPVLVDTLSFEKYTEGQPWVAYRQFCQHFLAPLALMAYTDVRLNQLLRVYIDGVPLDLASRLLPGKTRWKLGLSMHIHLHASAQRRYSDKTVDKAAAARQMNRTSFVGLIESLEGTVRRLSWKGSGTEWGDYYPESSSHYSAEAADHKKEIVSRFIEHIRPRSVWDLGANTGVFSRLASERGIPTVAWDIDPAAVEQGYQISKKANQQQSKSATEQISKSANYPVAQSPILHLVLDLTNPSPAIGWRNRERMSLLERGPADAVLALALIHHLAISNNVPLPALAEFFHAAGRWLVIEFVPKGDSQVQKLLATREDIFQNYTVEGFEAAFGEYFTIHETAAVPETPRVMYLMERR